MKKTKSVRPKFSEKSNTNIKILAEKTAQELRGQEEMKGVENFIPTAAPIPEPIKEQEKDTVINVSLREVPSLHNPPLFSGGFWDSVMALSFVGGFISLGICIGLSL